MRIHWMQVVGALLAMIVPAGLLAQAPNGRISLEPTTRPDSHPASIKLNLDQAVATALRNSKTLRTSVEAILKARGRVNEAKSAYLPTASSDTQFIHLDSGTSVQIPVSPTETANLPIVMQDQKQVSITASVPLDIMGEIKAAVDAAHFNLIATRLDYDRARNQLVADVKSAYYNVLRAQAFQGVAEQALKNAEDRLATAQAYLRAGTGTRFDVLRADTEVANARQNLIAAKNRVTLAIAALNNVLSLDQNTPLEVADVPGEDKSPVKGFDQAVEEAYRLRPEIMQAEAGIHAAEKGIHLAKRSYLPSAGLAWVFQYTPDNGAFSPKETSWSAVLKVTIPIFDGGVTAARVQQAKADLNTAKLAKLQAQDGVALETRQAYLSVVEAQDRLAVTNAALAEAEEQYRLAQVRYKAGVTQTPGGSPLLEISDAQTALTQAQSNRINARYDLQDAIAQLERAMGRYAQETSSVNAKPAKK